MTAFLASAVVVIGAIVMSAVLTATIVLVVAAVIFLPPVLAIWPPVQSEAVSWVDLAAVWWACVYSDLGVPT